MTDPTLSETSAARQRMSDAAHDAEIAVSEAASKLKSSASQTAAAAKDHAVERAEGQIDNAATGLQSTADRLRGVASDLDEKDQWLGTALSRSADVADKAGDYLSGQNLGNIVNDAQRLARNNPAMFMAGAAAVGFALSRIGKATVERAQVQNAVPPSNYGQPEAQYREVPATGMASTPPRLATQPIGRG